MSDSDGIKFRYFAGIRVFLNPHLFIEMKEITEENILILVIHMTLETYRIGKRYIVSHNQVPNPGIVFTPNISWRLNTESHCPLHDFYKTPREAHMINPFFQFTYCDTDRIEHLDGTVLWQKQRQLKLKGALTQTGGKTI